MVLSCKLGSNHDTMLLASQLSADACQHAVLRSHDPVGHGKKLLVYSVSCEIC